MALLQTKHTLSRINKVKRDLNKLAAAVSYLSMAVFAAYYVYLMIRNWTHYLYLAIYSCLIAVILTSFIVELCIRKDKKLLKNERRLVSEKKRKIKTVVKIVKFAAKTVLVGIAVYETVTNKFDLSLSNLVNVLSAVVLVAQILLELVINYVVKQIDYFRLSMELDLEESGAVIKKITNLINPMRSLEENVIKANDGALHSEQEEKMIENIRQEANAYVEEREQRERALKELYGEQDKGSKRRRFAKIFKKRRK